MEVLISGSTGFIGRPVCHALLEAGATQVYACATHGLFPDSARDAYLHLRQPVLIVHGTVADAAGCRRATRR